MSAAAIPSVSPSVGAPARRGTGRIWPLLIVALIAMNASIVGITVYFATSDKSGSVEPDYYAQALKYGDTIRQRATSAALGWTAEPSLRAAAGGRTMDLVIALEDRSGHPIDGAIIHVMAFASARASDRQSLTLGPDGVNTGQYVSLIRIDRSGLWCLRITVQRGADTFSRQTDLLIPDQPR